jgi:outer membrane receptor protein involved in Fe transport
VHYSSILHLTSSFVKVCFFLILLFSPSLVWAFDITGTLTGVVTDSTGRRVEGAQVIVRNVETNLTRETVTTETGMFNLTLLPVGDYEITVKATDFAGIKTKATILINQIFLATFELKVANISGEVIEVKSSDAIALVTTDSSTQSTVIGNTQILRLPLNSRNFLELLGLVPGVASAVGGGGSEGGIEGGNFSVGGQRDRAVNFSVDGIDNNHIVDNNSAASISVDAIQEFNILTSTYTAEYGRSAGAIVNVITKSGTNQLHGTLFEFLRNDKLDASNIFDNAAGLAKPKFRNNQFGFNLGGPVVKDNTFFFINYEGQRTRVGNTTITNVPTILERQGIFIDPSTGQQIKIPVDPTSARLLSFFPLPNSNSGLGNFVFTGITRLARNHAVAKIDQKLGPKDQLNFRYLISEQDAFKPIFSNFGNLQSSAEVPGFGNLSNTRIQNISVAETHVFSSNTVNEFRFGYSRLEDKQLGEDTTDPALFGLPNNNMSKLGKALPEILITGASGLGNSSIFPFTDDIQTYQFINNLSFSRGRHNFKTGIDIRKIYADGLNDFAFAGTLTFDGSQSNISPIADFIQGTPQNVFIGQGNTFQRRRLSNYYFYFQDDFKVSSRLVINAGLRYELNTVPTAFNQIFNFTPSRGIFNGSVYNGDHNNFAPRIGFAYNFGDNKTVIRGGVGVFYDLPFEGAFFALTFNPPNSTFLFNSGSFEPGELRNTLTGDSLDPSGPSFTTIDPNFRTPYSFQYNLTLQRELPAGIAFEIGYVGARGVKLLAMRDINQPLFFPGASSEDIFDRRPTQLLGQDFGVGGADVVQEQQSIGTSIYNSLQMKVAKRFGDGLTLLSSYTYSTSIDNTTDVFGFRGTAAIPQDANNLRAERGFSPFDIRQRFTLGYSYELPFGKDKRFLANTGAFVDKLISNLQINGIVTLQGGQPLTVLLGMDAALTGNFFTEQRPNNIPGAFIQTSDGRAVLAPHLRNADGSPNFIALQAAGVIPAPGNTFRGPNYKNVDFSLTKRTALSQNTAIEFRAEFFNLFNRPAFALPDNNLNSRSFGQFLRTPDIANDSPKLVSGSPRVIQFGLKLIF